MLATDYDRSTHSHLPKITIEVIHHDKQRYETCGDWYYNEAGELVIKVSETTTKYEFLVAIHELIEAVLCDFKGIKEEDVTAFDKQFEDMRIEYPDIVGDKEPGNEDNAPYFHEHAMASRVENWLVTSIGVDPVQYEKTINDLTKLSKF